MPKKILIVDDDVGLAEEMAEILRDEGYWVESASDSSQGEKLIKENTHDIYLLDYKMSGLSGVDLLRKVKEKNSNSAVFIISGRPFIEKLLKEENVLHLLSGVVKKPFEISDLITQIETVLGNERAGP
ncbi:MAG: hypothetical protein A3K83_06120 [Omnitrophica WOR_2 bacterium RBG_13_44_8b]|nr:MAG: hypothetical protein A3K83_06120 [Omnitrophica WOR_2 bacterium RBG_13_44_8b]